MTLSTQAPQSPSRPRLGSCFAWLSAAALAVTPWVAFAAPPKKAPPPPTPAESGDWFAQIQQQLTDSLQSGGAQVAWQVLLSLLLFIVGWIAAKLISWAVYKILTKTEIDNWIAERIGIDLLFENKEAAKKAMEAHALERGIAAVVFWLLMALVVVGVLEFVGLSKAAGPIERLVDTVVQTGPTLLWALGILVVAYLAASILRKVVTVVVSASRIDARLAELSGDAAPAAEGEAKAADADAKDAKDAEEQSPVFSDTAGQIVFWLIMTLGLAGFFDALKIEAISGPLRNAIERIVTVLPSLGVAALLVAAGWIFGRVMRAILSKLLASIGLDRLAERANLGSIFGDLKASGLAGLAMQVFIVLQAVLAALNELGLKTLSEPLTDVMTRFWNVLPTLAVSILIIAAGVVVGRLVRAFVATALRNVGFERMLAGIGVEKLADREDRLGEPSELGGFVAQAVIVLVALTQALQNVGLQTWAGYVDALLEFGVQRALVALAVVAVGFVVGNYVRDVIHARQPTAEGAAPRWMGEFARSGVLVFAVTMAIHQIGVAENFVLLAFALLFGALCLAAALAFGLGAREIAGDVVKQRWAQMQKESKEAAKPAAPARAPLGAGPLSSASTPSSPLIERPASTGVITPPSIFDQGRDDSKKDG